MFVIRDGHRLRLARVFSDRSVPGSHPQLEHQGRPQGRDGQPTSLERTMVDDVNDVIRRLDAIRQSVGGAKVGFVPHIEDRDLATPEEVEDLFHRSGLLIYLQNPVFVYIRDHTVGTFVDTRDRRRIHFSVCTTLRNMRNQGRFERCRRTTRVDDVYLIDVKSGRDGEIEVPLYPCKHCLKEVNYPHYGSTYVREDRQRIVEEFRARDALDFLRDKFKSFDAKIGNIQPASLSSGYSPDWPQRSHWFRKRRKFTCEKCGVQLKFVPHLLDMHHVDGDKRNDHDQNLRCLCKLCHARMHPHYTVSDRHKKLILETRRKQGLSDVNG